MHEPDQILLDLQERECPSFDNFVIADNTEAVQVLVEVSQGRGPKFVYLYGCRGAGLTHLLKALTPEQTLRVPIFDTQTSIYTVDDVDELDLGYTMQLLTLQNAVRNAPHAHLVCAGRVPAHQLNLKDDVKSRLCWGLSYSIKPLDEKARLAELSRVALARGFVLTPDILQWMALYLPRDMRTLMAVLEEVDHLALLKKRKVTLPLVREAVQILQNKQKNYKNIKI